MFPLIAPPLSWTILSPTPSMYNFVPNGKIDVSAATVIPSVALAPLAVIPVVLPQHCSQAQ